MNKRSNFIIIGILLVVFILLWGNLNNPNTQNQRDNQEVKYHSEVKLSNLPADINQSINKAVKRANNFKKPRSLLNMFSSENIIDSSPLILELHYADDVVEKKITNMPESFVGLTRGQLKLVLDNWKIKEYNSSQALVLQKEIPEVSPKGKGYYHLGIKDDRVAIFYGKKGNSLKQMTEITVNELPPGERRTLQEGIVVQNEEELLAILEGLRSINR